MKWMLVCARVCCCLWGGGAPQRQGGKWWPQETARGPGLRWGDPRGGRWGCRGGGRRLQAQGHGTGLCDTDCSAGGNWGILNSQGQVDVGPWSAGPKRPGSRSLARQFVFGCQGEEGSTDVRSEGCRLEGLRSGGLMRTVSRVGRMLGDL